MKRIIIAAALVATAFAIPTTTQAARQEKVDVCHDGDDGWKLINIADKAVNAHLNHGDALPGDDVPGMEGFEFDADCSPVATYTLIEFDGASETVGDHTANQALVLVEVMAPDSEDLLVGVSVTDTGQASDGGYSWRGLNSSFTVATNTDCRWPVTQVRARVELDGTVYRLDWDGYDDSGFSPALDVPGPWDLQDGDLPTLIVESVSLDLAATPVCTTF